MAVKKSHGHYCKICGQRKSNESFSGKGHASHICKTCAKLSPAAQAEAMTMNRLFNLPCRRLTDSELKWLKNRTQDHREHVRTLAEQVYGERFPHAQRNDMKKQLLVRELKFTVHADVWDMCGDEVPVYCRFYLKRGEPVIRMEPMEQPGESMTARLDSGKYARLLKSLIHDFEIFCWEQDYVFQPFDEDEYCDSDFDLGTFIQSISFPEGEEESAPLWQLFIGYCNGTTQVITGSGGDLPGKVKELYRTLSEYFEPEEDWETV